MCSPTDERCFWGKGHDIEDHLGRANQLFGEGELIGLGPPAIPIGVTLINSPGRFIFEFPLPGNHTARQGGSGSLIARHDTAILESASFSAQATAFAIPPLPRNANSGCLRNPGRPDQRENGRVIGIEGLQVTIGFTMVFTDMIALRGGIQLVQILDAWPP